SLQPSAGAARISGEELERLIRQYLATMDMIERLSRRTDPNILRAMVDLPALDEDALRDGRRMEDWFRRLEERVNHEQPTGTEYRTRVNLSQNGSFHDAVVTKRMHGIFYPYTFPMPFFLSPEYETIRRLSEVLAGRLDEDAHVH